MRGLTFSITLAAGIVAGQASVRSAEEPNGGGVTVDRAGAAVIPADDALSHVGKTVTVEFFVASSRLIDAKGPCFLNSKKDHRDKGNFTTVIFQSGLDQWKAKGVADPSQEYLGKKIRASGRIEERDGQAQIVVDSPAQIAVVPTTDGDITDGEQGR